MVTIVAQEAARTACFLHCFKRVVKEQPVLPRHELAALPASNNRPDQGS